MDSKLFAQAIVKFPGGLLIAGLLLFLPAGTFSCRQGSSDPIRAVRNMKMIKYGKQNHEVVMLLHGRRTGMKQGRKHHELQTH